MEKDELKQKEEEIKSISLKYKQMRDQFLENENENKTFYGKHIWGKVNKSYISSVHIYFISLKL